MDTPNQAPDARATSDVAAGGMFYPGNSPAGASEGVEPIHTGAEGLVVAEVAISTPAGGALPAYVARPDAPGAFAAVVVISEVFGVHQYIRDVCRRLAKLGYVAIAPQLFFRAGDPAPLSGFPEVMKLITQASNEQVLTDVRATTAWLEEQPFVDAGRLGITGFCWGGAVVWMACAEIPALKAGVAWYGRLARPDAESPMGREERPWPIDIAQDLRAPVLGLYAGQDHGIPLSDVERMREALNISGKDAEIIVYPQAEHGFHSDYRSSYDAAAAQDGWSRMQAWFSARGVRRGA